VRVRLAVGHHKQRLVLKFSPQAHAQSLGRPERHLRLAQPRLGFSRGARRAEIVGKMRHLVVQFVEDVARRQRRRRVGLARVERVQPDGHAREGIGEVPADQQQNKWHR